MNFKETLVDKVLAYYVCFSVIPEITLNILNRQVPGLLLFQTVTKYSSLTIR